MMRNTILVLVLICSVLACVGGLYAQDEASHPSVGVATGYNSHYIWRGIALTDGPVMQSELSAEYKGLSFIAWNNMDLDSVNDLQWQVNEIDLIVGYDWSVRDFGLSVGVVHYTFPSTAFAATTELYVGVSAPVPLSPTVTFNFDVDEVDGEYITFDVSHSFGLPTASEKITWSLDLGFGFGYGSADYNSGYFGVQRGGMVDYHPTVALPLSIGKFTLTPAFGYSALGGQRLKNVVDKNSTLFGGVTAGFTF